MTSWKALPVCRASCVTAWLLLSLLVMVGPVAGQQLPIPQLTLWQAQMTSYGQTTCDFLSKSNTFDNLLNAVYYDAQRVFLQIGDYTGVSSWTTCANTARSIYRDQYVIRNNGSVPGYWNFTTGLTMDYLRTGNATSQNAVTLLSQNAAYAQDGTPLSWTQSAELSREVAYAIISYINAEKVGAAPRARLPQLVDQALGHIDQWFISKSYLCPDNTGGACPTAAYNQYYIQPFMVGLTSDALIQYFQKTGDTRILPAIQTALDWLWTNAWVATDQAFWYENWVSSPSIPFPAAAGTPDLNLLIAPAYAWVYTQTGDTKYRDRGDAIFAGGVLGAYLGGGK